MAENIELVGQLGGGSYAVAVAKNYAYAGLGSRLAILDITDPGHPKVVGVSPPLPDLLLSITVAGDYAYVANGRSGLRILDVSDPTRPLEMGFYDTPGDALGVAVVGGYAFVADGRLGLRVLDVSNPARPRVVATNEALGIARSVAVSGDYVYVTGSTSLRILKVADLTTLAEVGSYAGMGRLATRVVVAGAYAYVAMGSWGLGILNISDPTRPNAIRFYETHGSALGIATVNDHIFVAAGSGGLRIIDVSKPTVPTEVGFYEASGDAWGVAVADSYALIAYGAEGLRIVRFSSSPQGS